MLEVGLKGTILEFKIYSQWQFLKDYSLSMYCILGWIGFNSTTASKSASSCLVCPHLYCIFSTPHFSPRNFFFLYWIYKQVIPSLLSQILLMFSWTKIEEIFLLFFLGQTVTICDSLSKNFSSDYRYFKNSARRSSSACTYYGTTKG